MTTTTDAQRAALLTLAGDSAQTLATLLVRAIPAGATAAQAAKACHAVLREVAQAAGQSPDLETFIRKPGEERHYGDTRCWAVVWEAGPHDWAVTASMAITHAHKLVEPYYGFDLMFYPGEWA